MVEWFVHLGWLDSILRMLRWCWKGVFWGLFPIVLSSILPIFWGQTAVFPSDGIFALSILAITICATQVEFPPDKPDIQRRLREWLPRLTYLVVVVAIVLSIATNENIKYANFAAPTDSVFPFVVTIFVISVFFGLMSFIINEVIEEKHISSLPEQRRATVMDLSTSARSKDAEGELKL
jgi:hypothetical protein